MVTRGEAVTCPASSFTSAVAAFEASATLRREETWSSMTSGLAGYPPPW
jgi:hypothetical protein